MFHFLFSSFLSLLKLPHPFSLYSYLLLFPPFYFCSLEHSVFQISKSCFLAWVVYLRLISEAWCFIFYNLLFLTDEGGGGQLHQPPTWRTRLGVDFWSKFSSSSPWQINIKLPTSTARFGSPRVFYFPGTHNIWWVFPYPPPGEAPVGRLAASHGQYER